MAIGEFDSAWAAAAGSYGGSGRSHAVALNIVVTYPTLKRTDMLSGGLDAVMKKNLKRGEGRYKQVTRNWEGKNKPTWEYKMIKKNEEWEMKTSSVPFVFVGGGTRVRKAKMSHDFRPQTSYRSLSSRARKGRVIARGWMAGVNPGIEGRDFTFVIAERIGPKYRQDMEAQFVKNAAKITKARSKKGIKIRML